MLLDDIDITRWPVDRVRRGGIAYLPEGHGIFPRLSVQDNLRMGARQTGRRSDRADAIEQATSMFPVLHEPRRQQAGSLSGGEQ
jgi:ABC-type branched-subunit amino acid transport system ATPase component